MTKIFVCFVLVAILGQTLAAPKPISWSDIPQYARAIGRKTYPIIVKGCQLVNGYEQRRLRSSPLYLENNLNPTDGEEVEELPVRQYYQQRAEIPYEKVPQYLEAMDKES